MVQICKHLKDFGNGAVTVEKDGMISLPITNLVSDIHEILARNLPKYEHTIQSALLAERTCNFGAKNGPNDGVNNPLLEQLLGDRRTYTPIAYCAPH